MSESDRTSSSFRGVGRVSWPRIVLSLILVIVAVYFVSRNIEPGDIRTAVRSTDARFIFLALIAVVASILLKTLRWQLIFSPRSSRPPFRPLFWALSLGQFLNTMVPLRLGEVARIFSLEQNAGTSKALTLSTLVVEKTLELATLVLVLLLLLSTVVLPDFVSDQGVPLAIISLALLLVLFMLAFNDQRLVRYLKLLFSLLPASIEVRLVRLTKAGFQGLAALRDWRQMIILGLASAIVFAVAVLVPYLLFQAFSLPLLLSDAVLLHVLVSIGTTPPSTPGKVIIFEGIVVFTLRQFGLIDNGVILSFAIIFHLVIVLPQIAFGSIAAARGSLKWPAIYGSGSGQAKL